MLDEQEFVYEFIKSITYNETNSLCEYITNLVKSATIDANIYIIHQYCGDIYEAIELYQKYINKTNDNTYIIIYKNKKDFYEKLAYISLYRHYYPIINKILSKSMIFNY